MNTIKNLQEIFDDLKLTFPKVPDAELLKAAAQVQNTEAIRAAFVLDWIGEMSGLEAIAVMLGKKEKTQSFSEVSIPDAISKSTDRIIMAIEEMADKIKKKRNE